ncbi:MAG: DUF3854 domain-containing protein [Symploca sp. SIO1C2]|nr:DUF3854 domain-containing protein [Symploca sp. SIO1C2]
MKPSYFKGFSPPHSYSKGENYVERIQEKTEKGSEVETGSFKVSKSSQVLHGDRHRGSLYSRAERVAFDSCGRRRNDDLRDIPAQFWNELTVESAIDPELVNLNCRFIKGDEVYSTLLYAKPQSEIRRNDGRLKDKWLKKYSQIADDGALYFNGLDPHQNWEKDSEWGRLKPITPRIGLDGKTHKYESPVKPASYHPLYFRVTDEIWSKIATRYGVPMSGENFWQWIQKHPEITVNYTEGEKKALCLLSLGFPAIALPGIWCGRVGNKLIEHLHPDLMPIAKGRKFNILFDYEEKQKTRWQIFQATQRTGKCIQDAGGKCEVTLLPGKEKGVDDWVVSLGKKADKALTTLIGDSLTLTEYRQQFFIPARGLRKYKPDVRVNTKRLSDAVRLPTSGVVCLLSGMGTGKTYLMEKWRIEHPEERFLNNGHRIALLRNLSERLKTQMYSDLHSGDYGKAMALSVTADSLWKLSNNLEGYDCVFVDETAQYVAHLLQAKTLKEHRHEILEVLKYVVRNAKLLVLADAHLTDEVIDFFMSMRPSGEKPYIIQNNWLSGGRKVHWYEGGNPSAVVAKAEALVEQGKKVMLVSNSKKFIKKMEKDLIDLFPDKQFHIKTLHGDNSGSPENAVFIKNINEEVNVVYALLASPTLGTGVDIPDYHFDVVIGVFYSTTQAATDCAQQLWRYRPNVPMHIWVQPRPSFGYRETNPRKIKQDILWKNNSTGILIRIDPETGERKASDEWVLDTYCQIEARRGRSINNLRQDLRSLLEEMGNTIMPMGDEANEAARLRLKAAAAAIDEAHCLAVSHAADIDKTTYLNRQKKDYLSDTEVLECEKFRIWDTYGMEVTPELVKKDDVGKLIRKIIEFEGLLGEPESFTNDNGQIITAPPKIVSERDLNDREYYPICTDWGHRSLAWFTRDQLGLRALVHRLLKGEEYSQHCEDVIKLAEIAKQNAAKLKTVLGRTVSQKDSPTKIVGDLLSQLGLSTKSRRLGARGKQVRHYCLNCEDVAFNSKVLDYRTKKREERERRRLQEQEDNERHRRALQIRYGSIEPQSKVEQGLQPVVTPPKQDGSSNNFGGRDYQQHATHCTDEDELVTQEQLQVLKNIYSESTENARKMKEWVFWHFLLGSVRQLTQSMYWQIIDDFAFAAF